MKRLLLLLPVAVLFSLSMLFGFNARAQAIDSLLTKAFVTNELLPLLIDSALKNSPQLKGKSGEELYAQANLDINKKEILSSVKLQSSYNYGTNYSAVNNQNSTLGGSNLTTAQTGFYNLGIGIQLPISYIVNRKSIIKAGRAQVNIAASGSEYTATLITQEVTRLYQALKLAQRLMIVSATNRQAAHVNNMMAEKDFLNGQTTVDKIATVLESYNKSIIDFETYSNTFQTSYMQLEIYTGVNLSSLIMRVK